MSQSLDTTAAVMAEFLSRTGVRKFFGYPGTSNIEFMESSRKRGVETVLARREATAAFMAEGYAMVTGLPGVCLSTLGPGSTALLNGVAAANLDRVPMVAISGQIGSASEPYFTHQVVDHGRIYAPVTKWAGRVEARSVSTIMRKALRLATAERPGAVHLTTNADVAGAEPGDVEIALPPMGPAASAAQVFRADGAPDPVRLLVQARRPVLLAGGGATRADATPALRALSEQLGIPVVVAPMAKGVFPEDHEHFAGVIDMACNQVVWDFLGDADLIVAAGFDPVELIKPWGVRTPVLHIDAVPNTDQIYRADVEVVGHVGAILSWLASEAEGEPRWSAAEIERHRTELRRQYYEGRVEGRLNPTDVIDVLRGASGRDAIVTTDVGSHKLLVGQGWATHAPRRCLMSNGLSSMGFSVPGAIGAKLASPDSEVVCTVGDGGFAMVAGELRLAATLGLEIVFVVFNDRSLNRIELKQKALGYPSTATTLDVGDLAGMAESMGCDGVRADSAAALEKALTGPRIAGRPLLIDAQVDPSQYESQF